MFEIDMFGRKIRRAILREEAGNGEGGGPPAPPEWLATAPEEYQKDPHIAKYKTQEEFFKAEKSQRELLGRKGVILPTEKATPEERAAFYNQLGRPEKPEGYKLTLPEKLPAGFSVTPEFQAKAAAMAHKWGMSQAQAQEMVSDFLADAANNHVQQMKMSADARNAAGTELRNKWGAKYDENFAKAGKAIKAFGGDELLAELGELGNRPRVVEAWASVGDKISEDKMPNLNGGGNTGGSDTGDAQKQIEAINADSKHAYWDGNHKDHMKAVADMTVLFGKAHVKK